MKGLFTFLLVACVTMFAWAQAPQAINYQAVLRDGSGNILASQAANLRFSILQGSITGTAVYVETHAVTTSSFGAFSLGIGSGTATSGTFASIDWANGPYFLKTELDNAGTYVTLSTTQFLSVPYALYAGSVANAPVNVGCFDTLDNSLKTLVAETHTDSDNDGVADRYAVWYDLDSAFYRNFSKEVYIKFFKNGIMLFEGSVMLGPNTIGNINRFGANPTYSLIAGDLFVAEHYFMVRGCTYVHIHTKQL